MNLARAADRLLAHALSLPGAWEDHPWGERVAKAGKKVFLFFGHDHRAGEELTLAVKLPSSSIAALDRPECEPTGYGLGKSGWVTAKYRRGDTPPLELLESWIVESYRATAPKTLVKQLDGGSVSIEKTERKATAARKKKASSTAKKKSARR